MLFDRLKQNKTPELDPGVADQMLQNVFDVCDMESNSVPLEVLESYARYRKERFALQKALLIAIMVLFCMLPVLFIAPDYTLEKQSEKAYNTTYELKLDGGLIPVRHITAEVDGKSIPVHDKGGGIYSVEPNANGTMSVTVELANRQYVTRTAQISDVDTENPELVSSEVKGEKALLYVADDGAGVDYDAIYAIDANGNRVHPLSFDEKKGLIVFDYPDTEIHVYIPDKAENVLQLLLKTSS